jgi:hypothetical protein
VEENDNQSINKVHIFLSYFFRRAGCLFVVFFLAPRAISTLVSLVVKIFFTYFVLIEPLSEPQLALTFESELINARESWFREWVSYHFLLHEVQTQNLN